MPILSINVNNPGQSGVLPQILYIQTNDTLATVLTTGYLDGVVSEGLPLSTYNMALVATKTSPAATTASVDWLQVVYSGGKWSLAAPAITPGTVTATLPTIANHIATYTNTTGHISEDAATAINAGNIQAGLVSADSPVAGYLVSVPGNASSGVLRLTAVNNSAGNFNTIISNAASVGQTQTVSVPDGGTAASNFLISNSAGTQTIATGNLTVTAGTITATAGNLVAGSSGAAGVVESFPATGSKGHLTLAAVANTGNTVTTISNDAMGQASTVNIPDPGNTVGQFLVGATATPFVSGNFPQNSGTAGLMVDSGVSVASLSTALQSNTVSVTMTASQVNGAYAAPFLILAAPASGKAVLVTNAWITTASTGQTAFANGGVGIVQYTNTVNGAGTNALSATIPAAEIAAATSQIYSMTGYAATTVTTGITAQGLYFSNQTQAFTAGTGSTITVTLRYVTLTATV